MSKSKKGAKSKTENPHKTDLAGKNTAENSESERKPLGRPFLKGQSGNPGGKPKALREVQEAAREEYTAQVVARLGQLILSEDEHVARAACCDLWDRMWGKPTQSLQVSGPEGTPLQSAQAQVAQLIVGDEVFRAALDRAAARGEEMAGQPGSLRSGAEHGALAPGPAPEPAEHDAGAGAYPASEADHRVDAAPPREE